MGITRPTGEQLRFRSATTGDHILDTYMENSEKGSRTLPDLMDDLFDSSGVFRSANFEFRFDTTTDKIQFRAGNFANSNTGWTDITTFFNITGAFNASTTYNNFDLLTLTNKDVYIVHGLSSGTTFADEAAVIASANTEKLVDVSEARDWASKTDGQVVSTDYSSKAYAVGGTGVDATTGSAKDWAIKTSSTVGNTGEYSAKYWATSTAVTTVSSGIANINTVAAAIANVNTTATNISNVNTVAGISADVTTVANISGNVSTVAGISANTTTVAGIAANVTTVAGVHANVTTVAGIASNVTTVANNNTDVSTVATNITDLQTVADEIDNNNLQTVANDINAVVTAANDLNEATSEIETVANSITNVDLVGGSISNVNTVATNIANVNTTATNIANVNTVGGISANVTTVAGISANVTTAATNNANITTVAGISANVTTVAGISANVTTVANISADVTTAASNVTAFNNTYLGAQSSAPTQDPDGSALDVGDLYFDTTSNTMKVYAASGWTAAGSSVNGTADRFNYTATAGQTTFTGADDNNNTLAYDAGFADIYMNGVKLAPADYTANSGSSVILASGAALNDTIEIIAYGTFTLANLSLNDLTDVSTTNNADHKILAYNVANQQFEPRSTATLTGLYLTGSATITDNSALYLGTGLDLSIFHDAGTGDSHIQETGTGNLKFDTNNTTRMLLDQSGNLLVGKTSADVTTAGARIFPTGDAAFVTDGAAPIIANRLTSDGDIAVFRKDGTTVGSIGNASGSLVFYLAGPQNAVKIVGPSAGVDSIGPSTTSGGNRDNAMDLGWSSNRFKDLYLSGSIEIENGTGNVGVGKQALNSNTGSYNTALGYQTGYSNTSGSGSTFVGRLAGYSSNATGNVRNTFVGYLSGYTNTGTANTFIGAGPNGGSGETITTGSKNTIIGAYNGSQGGLDIRTSDNQIVLSDGDGNPRMRVTSTGQFMFPGTASPNPHVDGTGVQIYGTSGIMIGSSSTHALIAARHGTDGECIRLQKNNTDVGSIDVTTSGTTYTTTSDRRLKTDIQPIEHATDMLMAMNPVTHRWKADPDADAVVGFIAQEMQEIVPEAVSGEPDGEEMMSMDYGRITPVLVAALQDAHKKIEALEERLAELEAK